MEVGERTAKYDLIHPETDEVILKKGNKYLTSPGINDNNEVYVCSKYWFWISCEYFEEDYKPKYGKEPITSNVHLDVRGEIEKTLVYCPVFDKDNVDKWPNLMKNWRRELLDAIMEKLSKYEIKKKEV